MEVLIFAGKALIVVVSLGALFLMIALLIARGSIHPEMEVTPLHEKLQSLRLSLLQFVSTKKEIKAERKKLKKEEKQALVSSVVGKTYVLRFDGDVKASQVEGLREEITAILQVAKKADEVVAIVESPGGMVSTYGLAASQLLRLRESEIPLTVCVDVVAASGGYLMAVVAQKILAAPFAIVGSIGVVAQVPNFNRLLKKNDVDFKEYTAGEFKRTVSILGEITPKGEEKFQEQLEQTHVLFKSFVQKYRPQIDMIKVATGEYWYGQDALDLKLIDGLQTSDDYLLEKFKNKSHIFEISFEKKIPLSEKIAGVMGTILSNTITSALQKTKHGLHKELDRVKTP